MMIIFLFIKIKNKIIINRNFNHYFKLILLSLHQRHVVFFMVRF